MLALLYPLPQKFFPGLTKEMLPDGEAWAIEYVSAKTHTGTHLDAYVPQ